MSTISRLTTSTPGSGNGDSGSNTQATPTNNGGSQNEESNYQRGRRQNSIQLTNLKSYQGAISDIGAILALRHEKLDHKKQFQVFMEKVGTYVLSNLKDGGDVMPLFRRLENPTTSFDKKRKPKSLTDEQKQDPVNVDIYKEQIKIYVSRQCSLTRNTEKCYGIIWGQCSAGLHARIKGHVNYEDKSIDLDVVWLVQELKKATSGIDNMSDPRDTLIDSLAVFFKMAQGATEANDQFLDRFKANVSTLPHLEEDGKRIDKGVPRV